MPGDPPPAGRASRPDPRVTVAVITHNRREELARTLAQLAGLPEKPAIVVVDNGSDDGSAAYVRWSHPAVLLIAARRNLGAVGRNLALRHVMTPYVAFCDDDTWWEPGSLARAADALDAHPDVAAVTARIVVDPSGEDDPIVPELAHSPVAGRPGLPGPALLSIMAVAGRGGRAALHRPGHRRLLAVLPPRGNRSPSGFPGPRRVAAPPGRYPEHAMVHLAPAPAPVRLAANRRAGRYRAPRCDVGGGVRDGGTRSALGAAGTPAGATGGRGPDPAAGRAAPRVARAALCRLTARHRGRRPSQRAVFPARRAPARRVQYIAAVDDTAVRD